MLATTHSTDPMGLWWSCVCAGRVLELPGPWMKHHHHGELEHTGLAGWAELTVAVLPHCSHPLQSMACSSSLP